MKNKYLQYLEYQKNMKKVDNLKKRFILIQQYTGFGNKIFNCIVAIYLKYKFNYTIYYVNTKSAHEKKGDPLITDIFPQLDKEFEIIDDNSGDYIQYLLKRKNTRVKTNSLDNLSEYFIKDQMILSPTTLYNLVFDMYDKFTTEQKKIFEINKNLITHDIISYAETNYATIHIRYGDKLELAIRKNNNENFKEGFNFMTFPIYTPEYYYEQIKIIKKLKIPIIILTDSYYVIKHFLMDKYNLSNDPDIFFPNISFLDSFYLLLYSQYTVMSHSTFSYSAFLLSQNLVKNKSRVYTFCLIDEYYNKYNPADLFISNKWTIYKDKKYILNLNQEKVIEMNDYQQKYKK